MFLAEGGGATPPPAQNNFGDTLSDGVAGPTALLIIVLLAIGTVLLIRNMNGHLKRLPERFPVQAGGPSAGGTQTVGVSAGGTSSAAERGSTAQAGVRPATAEAGGGGGDPAGGAESGSAGSGSAEAGQVPEA
nr:hypothetical protein [Rugosimonospora africana]